MSSTFTPSAAISDGVNTASTSTSTSTSTLIPNPTQSIPTPPPPPSPEQFAEEVMNSLPLPLASSIPSNPSNSSPPSASTIANTNPTAKPEPTAKAEAKAEAKTKLHGYPFYRSIGSPKFIIAPMVDQSELAWRILSRQPIPPTYHPEEQLKYTPFPLGSISSSSSSSSLPTTTATASSSPSSINPSSFAAPGSPTSTTPTPSSSLHEIEARHPIGGAHLLYTPMFNARLFAESGSSSTSTSNLNSSSSSSSHSKAKAKPFPPTVKQPQEEQGGYVDQNFNMQLGEEGARAGEGGWEGLEALGMRGVGDRPLFVQFAANDPEILLRAARKVEDHCDAVDINFGCPQHIAKRGNFGSFLQDDWELVYKLINILHLNLSIPVTAKFRIFPDVTRTIAYAQMMERAGASILTCHGRTREMKGQFTGLADWQQIKAVKEAVKVPVFANGNILYREDVDRCLELTGVDGIMTAEGNLSNPAVFVPSTSPLSHPPFWIIAHHYLSIVSSLKTPTAGSAIRAHMFRLLRPGLEKHTQMRNKLANEPGGTNIDFYREVVDELKELVKDEWENDKIESWPADGHKETGLKRMPVWACQPYVRPLPVETYRALMAANAGARGEGPMEDMMTGGTGEERVIGEDGTQAGLDLPVAVTIDNCTGMDGEPCSNMASSACTTNSCLLHCRAKGALSSSTASTLAEALKLAAAGKLVGAGCAAHEEKDQARKDRKAELKKQAAARRVERKEKEKEKKRNKKRGRGDRSGEDTEEEGKEKKRVMASVEDEGVLLE